MGTVLLALVAAVACPPDPAGDELAAPAIVESSAATTSAVTQDASPRSPAETRKAVAAALRAAMTTNESQRGDAVRALLALYEELQQDTQLSADERQHLTSLVRGRLQKIDHDLQQKIARNQRAAAKAGGPATIGVPDNRGVLAQQRLAGGAQPPGNGANPSAKTDYGQDLVNLIQATIAPSTWEVNGGAGTIMYYGGLRVLVVSQQDEVQEDLGGLLRALRK